jgi:hypothetical protein
MPYTISSSQHVLTVVLSGSFVNPLPLGTGI